MVYRSVEYSAYSSSEEQLVMIPSHECHQSGFKVGIKVVVDANTSGPPCCFSIIKDQCKSAPDSCGIEFKVLTYCIRFQRPSVVYLEISNRVMDALC